MPSPVSCFVEHWDGTALQWTHSPETHLVLFLQLHFLECSPTFLILICSSVCLSFNTEYVRYCRNFFFFFLELPFHSSREALAPGRVQMKYMTIYRIFWKGFAHGVNYSLSHRTAICVWLTGSILSTQGVCK